jgi:YggT family protein
VELIIRLVNYLIILFTVAIFARALLSFLPIVMKPPYPAILESVNRVVNQITEPVLAPVRRMLPSFGGLDLSPMVVIVVLWFIRSVLSSLG